MLRVNPFFQATRFLYNFVQIPFSILIQNAHLCTNSSQPQPFSFTPLIQHFVRTFFSEITFCKRKQLPLKPLLTITTAAAAASAAAACGLFHEISRNFTKFEISWNFVKFRQTLKVYYTLKNKLYIKLHYTFTSPSLASASPATTPTGRWHPDPRRHVPFRLRPRHRPREGGRTLRLCGAPGPASESSASGGETYLGSPAVLSVK